MSNIDLRAYVFLDSLQAQYAAFLGTVAQGFLPWPATLAMVEVSPGIEINRLTDIALKPTTVTPGMQIVERFYGMLEVHSESQADVRRGRACDPAGSGSRRRIGSSRGSCPARSSARSTITRRS